MACDKELLNTYTLVLPVIQRTMNSIEKNLSYFLKYLRPRKVILIGSKEIVYNFSLFSLYGVETVFLDEDRLIPGLSLQSVKDEMSKIINGSQNRAGWYFQQFLKIAYAIICEEDEYLLWDSDTIPLHDVSMKQENYYYFDIKNEYHQPYFDTMKKLIPQLVKLDNTGSFISEHMIINKNCMLDLISRIESNTELFGDSFWKKILHAVDPSELSGAGFSEFETYGTFVSVFYPDMYIHRSWKSLREGGLYFKKMSEDICFFLKTKYDAISFESHEYKTFSGFKKLLLSCKLGVFFYLVVYSSFISLIRNR